jgi:hypothetical protein
VQASQQPTRSCLAGCRAWLTLLISAVLIAGCGSRPDGTGSPDRISPRPARRLRVSEDDFASSLRIQAEAAEERLTGEHQLNVETGHDLMLRLRSAAPGESFAEDWPAFREGCRSTSALISGAKAGKLRVPNTATLEERCQRNQPGRDPRQVRALAAALEALAEYRQEAPVRGIAVVEKCLASAAPLAEQLRESVQADGEDEALRRLRGAGGAGAQQFVVTLTGSQARGVGKLSSNGRVAVNAILGQHALLRAKLADVERLVSVPDFREAAETFLAETDVLEKDLEAATGALARFARQATALAKALSLADPGTASIVKRLLGPLAGLELEPLPETGPPDVREGTTRGRS